MENTTKIRLALNVCELIACITGLVMWRRLDDRRWKWFATYLTVIFLVEMLSKYFVYYLKDKQLNHDLFFYFGIPVQFLFFSWLFKASFRSVLNQRIALVGGLLYIASIFADKLYFSTLHLTFYSFSYLTGSVVMMALIVLFFLEFIKTDDLIHYKRSRMFWLCIGLLTFYLGSLPFYGLLNTISNYDDLYYGYWCVQMALNCLMYLFFTIVFLCDRKKSPSSLSKSV